MTQTDRTEELNQNTPLCILAAGRGSRLGSFTNAVNKALLPVNGKAVISHIIEAAPKNSEIIIALGYQGQKIRDYCSIAHSDRNFIFVDVNDYDGPLSGPGHSMRCCQEHLQRPFYFCTVDCIVLEKLPPINVNWIGVFPTDDPQAYSTARVIGDKVVDFVNKKPNGLNQAFIGLAGICSYEYFWHKLGDESEIVSVFYNPEEIDLRAISFTWLDTGTIDGYAKARKCLEGNQEFDFDKVGEFTYIVNNKVIKYFDDKSKVVRRVMRAKKISGTPEVTNQKDNFFAYDYVPGKTLYETVEEGNFQPVKLFNWLKNNLWLEKKAPEFKKSCLKFYRDKTLERFDMYKKKKGFSCDSPRHVNGQFCLAVEDYLEKVDWDYLTQGTPVVFHGDLQFDNIIQKPDGNFLLLDWRESFADQQFEGDLYYDLAKLNGGFYLPYNVIKSGAFMCVKNADNSVNFNCLSTVKINDILAIWHQWCYDMGYDIKKIEILTTLIYLNMSPLHAEPFDDLVFNLAKLRFSTAEKCTTKKT